MDSTPNDGLVDYSRQAELNEELSAEYNIDSMHIIIGCGGVGFWLGLMLAMMGATKFMLIEGDKLDASNLNRIPVPQTWIGLNKGVALRKIIRFVRPHTSVTVLQNHVDKENPKGFRALMETMGSNYSIKVWDTTDDAVVQRMMYKELKELGYDGCYTKLGYEGFRVGAYSNYNVWINPETYTAGYQTSRANAVTSAIAAGMGMFYKFLGVTGDRDINLKTLLQENYHGETPKAEQTKKVTATRSSRPQVHTAVFGETA